MAFIYHMVPKEMQGTVLYPLNTLKNIYPEAYADHVKKYEGRMQLLDQRIERLDCVWNDVLHCSALSPAVINAALGKLGKNYFFNFFEIPADLLEPENTVVYTYPPREKGTPISQESFILYDPSEVEKYAYLPKETEQYYKEIIEAGGNPLLYHLVPHILYKGNIDTKDLKISSFSSL